MAGSRRRGVGSITSYSTKSGVRWRWQLYVPIDPENPDDGTRQVGGGGFKTAADADDALDDAKRKLKARMTFARSVPTVADYVDQWIDGRPLERSTIAGYRRLARNHIRPYFETTQLDKMTSARLAKHYRELQAHGRRDGKGGGLSANTTAKVAALLGAVLDAAVSDGLIPVNPAKKRAVVQAPTGRQVKSAKPEMQIWTGPQLAAFLQWSRDQDDMLFPLWHLIGHTGARRSEALALRWGDVDMTNGRVAIRRALDTTQRATTKLTKSGGSRVVDIDDGTVRVLRALRAELASVSLERVRPDAYLFPNIRTGETRSPNEVSRRWRTRITNARTALGADALPAIRLHDLRHTHASLMLASGVPVKVVQERLGHASATITLDVYSHVLPGAGRAAADAFAAVVNGSG